MDMTKELLEAELREVRAERDVLRAAHAANVKMQGEAKAWYSAMLAADARAQRAEAERDEARIEAADGLAAFRLAQEARDNWREEADAMREANERLNAERDRLDKKWRHMSQRYEDVYVEHERTTAERDSLRKTLAQWNSEHPEEAEHDAEMGRLSRVLEEVKADRDELRERLGNSRWETRQAIAERNLLQRQYDELVQAELDDQRRVGRELNARLARDFDRARAERLGIAPGKDDYR